MGLLLVIVAGGVFCANRLATARETESASVVESESHNRLLRSEIPRMGRVNYSELFADMNDVQLEAAKRGGLRNPDKVVDPAQCDELVLVESSAGYAVDTLRHSKPYLVPQAARLLTYIGHRFDEIQTERGIRNKVRPIVTSLLRSRGDVGRLRRVNRNATENSCHLYGTTFDISYTRFMDSCGNVVTDSPKYKEMLAEALYELRFEGLCYVRYERRQPCFHITVRTLDYAGSLASETVGYEATTEAPGTTGNPGSPGKTGNPGTPGNPGISGNPGPPGKSGTPGISGNSVKPSPKKPAQPREHRSNYVEF